MEKTRVLLRERIKPTIILGNYDNVILFSVIALVMFGVVMIFSSSFYIAATSKASDYNMFYYMLRQLSAAGIGMVAMIVMSYINYRRLKGLVVWIGYFVSCALLVYVKYFGVLSHGARRWIKIPIFGSFQPSELAKLMVIIALAVYISENKDKIVTLKGLVTCGLIILLPCLLVFWGKNLSTAIIIGAIGFCMIFAVHPKFVPFAVIGGSAVAGLVAFLAFAGGFRTERFEVWFNPWIDPLDSGYQTIQGLLAVGSGGFFGLGLGQSHQKLNFMPEPFNDFIFAVICEELGFFGAAILLLLFIVLIWRGIVVALNATDMYGSLLALGMMVMIGVQVIINVAVVTNTIPNTGIPMPFISYGGTSVLIMMTAMGILLNISRYRNKGV